MARSVFKRSRNRSTSRAGTASVSHVERLEDRTLLTAPHPVNLGSLDGTTGFRLDGIDANDYSGRSVSSAGDVNGDGFDDVIIGARRADPGGTSSAGESYVVFGGNFTGGDETQVGDTTANTLTATQGAGVDILIGGQMTR